jgi:outer membrane murein-binding lipoprotein Lpp
MANYRFLVGSLAFGISFGAGLLIHRDVNKAFAIGFTTLPATLVAVAIADRQLYRQAATRITALKTHIRSLQRRRAETYQSLVELSAERDQVALALSNLHLHHNQPHFDQTRYQTRLPAAPVSSALPPARQSISWDLSAPAILEPTVLTSSSPGNTAGQPLPPTLIQEGRLPEPSLERVLSNAVASKQKLQTDLTLLQTELSQVQQQLADQRQKKDKLVQEVTELKQQKRQLENQSKVLRSEVQAMEQQRKEAEQRLVATRSPAPPTQSEPNGSKSFSPLRSRVNGAPVAVGQAKPVSTPQSVSFSVQPTPTIAPPEPARAEKGASDLSEEWMEFMVHLPEYEFLVLKAIAESSNPAPMIKRIAEDNLTMPEILIDTINERALDTIGDLLIDAQAGVGAATIVQEHSRAAKKLVKAYEELIQWEKG